MVKVNLLKPTPEGPDKTIGLKFGLAGSQKIILLIALILFVIGLSLKSLTYYRRNNLYRINSQYDEALKFKQEIKNLTQEEEKLTQSLSALSSYLEKNILWSDKLNALRNLIPKQVWLLKFSFEKKSAKEFNPSLYLSGGIISEGNLSPIGILSNFVNQLKGNSEFSEDFDNPALSDLRTEMKDNIEIMAFTIELPLGKRR